jgi:hypothetical protein
MPKKKKSHGFIPLILPGACCADLARVLDLEGMPDDGHMLGTVDDVIYLTVFSDDTISMEEPVLYCFCCGAHLAEAKKKQASH